MRQVGWKYKFKKKEEFYVKFMSLRDSSIFKWILLLRHLDSVYLFYLGSIGYNFKRDITVLF